MKVTKTCCCTLAVTLCAALAASSAFADDVPDSFIDYVESTGSQHVDTGIIGRYGTKVELRFAGWSAANTSLVGAISNSVHYLADRASGNKLRFIYNLSQTVNGTDFSTAAGANANNIYHVTQVEVTNDGTMKLRLDGAGETTLTTGKGQHTTGLNLYLFAANSGGNAGRKSSARLFGCRIWQDGALVRDFRPCMKDGKAALYDTVGQTIYLPSGGDLVAPNDKPIFVTYAQSSGTQYVDTGIEGRYGTTVEARYSDMTVSRCAMFGSVGTNNNHFLGMRNGGNLRFIYGLSGKSGDKYTAATYDSNVREVKTEVTADGAMNVYVEGVVKTQVGALGQNTTGLDMYLFAGNSRGTVGWQASVKLYGCKIWQDGNLVRNFLPCRKDELVGMYDQVEGVFHPSVNALVAGPDLPPAKFVEYVQSSGSQYINTGVVGRYGTTVEMKFSDMTVRNTALFGAVNNGTHFLGMCNYYGSGLRFIYNTSGGAGDTNTPLTFGAGAGHDIKCEVTTDGAVNVSVDGAMTKQVAALGRFSTGLGMFIFAGNNGGGASWSATVKMHCLRIWQDGVLVRDFRPCADASGKAALYDVVNCRIHYPSGGDLTASATEVPATAVWKGGAVSSAADLSNPANWDCFRPDGTAAPAGLVPTAQTTVVVTDVADALLSIPSDVVVPEWGDVKIAASVTLPSAADWSALGRLTLGKGVSVNLNGNTLNVADFVAESGGNASVVNSGASPVTMTLVGSGMSSLERITLGDMVKLLKSGGGLLGVASEYRIGADSRNVEMEIANGVYWMEGVIRLAYNAPGTLIIRDGAKVYVNDGSVGHNSGGVGTLNMTGGELSVKNNLWFGAFGTSVAAFNQSGGTAVIELSLRLAGANASSTSAQGSFVQTGGTLQTGQIFQGTGVATVVLDGGTLKPNKAATDFFSNLRDVTLGANGVTIDSAYNIGALGTTITVQNGGKIIKTGAGEFDLSGLTVQMGEGTTSSFDFAVAGASAGGFTGVPTVPRSWKAKLSEDGKTCRIVRNGFAVIVK